jgi:hypothetical protein
MVPALTALTVGDCQFSIFQNKNTQMLHHGAAIQADDVEVSGVIDWTFKPLKDGAFVVRRAW